MGGMFIEREVDGKRELVRGKKRDADGVKAFDGDWKRALSRWQEEELKKRLKRKRTVDGVLSELADVEDPVVLERLKKSGRLIREAVTMRKAELQKRVVGKAMQDNSTLRVGKRNLK